MASYVWRRIARLRTALFIFFVPCVSLAQAPSYAPKFAPVLDPNINGFWEYLPRDYDLNLSIGYPLLIYIHGAGDQGSTPDVATLSKVNRNGPPKLISEGKFPESFSMNGSPFSFIMLAPQIKNGVEGVTSTIAPTTIDALIEYAKTTYRVDPSRIYLVGMSMGGGGTWDYAGSPEGSAKLAAIAVAAGAADLTEAEATNIDGQGVAVLATHNTVDKTVDVARTRRNIGMLQTDLLAPPPPRAFYWDTPGQKNPDETDNGEHNVWTRTFEDIQPGTTAGGNLADSLGENVYQWMLTYTNSSNAILPLVWQGFTALEANKQVTLNWTVSDQTGVQQFVVEKSIDNRRFMAFGTLTSVSGLNDYHFVDASPTVPQCFYRIREVDQNGQYSFSRIRKVTTVNNPGSDLRVFPNPFTDRLFLIPPGTIHQALTAKIVDAQGRLVFLQRADYVGNAIILTGLGRLARGSYYLVLTDDQGGILFQQKLLKE